MPCDRGGVGIKPRRQVNVLALSLPRWRDQFLPNQLRLRSCRSIFGQDARSIQSDRILRPTLGKKQPQRQPSVCGFFVRDLAIASVVSECWYKTRKSIV